MKLMKHKNKYVEADREGFIRVYPSIREPKETVGIFTQLIKLLKRLKKGH